MIVNKMEIRNVEHVIVLSGELRIEYLKFKARFAGCYQLFFL